MMRRDPPISRLTEALGAWSEVLSVPIPLDCTDGFCEAYYGRPEGLLDNGARSACSVWSFQDRGRACPHPRWARDRYQVGRASSGAIPHRMRWRRRCEQGAAALARLS
jgi:hypothetical protein